MIKMGDTYCDRLSSYFALKPIEKVFFPLTFFFFLGTLVVFFFCYCCCCGTCKWDYNKFANWGLWRKWELGVFDLEKLLGCFADV